MLKILVAIDGTERGERALAWASSYAVGADASLLLATVVDPAVAQTYGVDEASVESSAAETLQGVKNAALAACPGLEIDTMVVTGKVVESIVDASEGCDMIVLGSHHGASVGETVSGAKGLRVSVSADVPTVVVPRDWDPDAQGRGIVVGVGPDESSNAAVSFGVSEALRTGEPLELVSAWGLPAFLSKPAEAMGGGLGPVGEQFQESLDATIAAILQDCPDLDVVGKAIEGPSPSRTLIDYAKGARLLVLGTHARSAIGRTVFGSVTHSVLLNLQVPTVIVP